jgi:hypothetical protein
MTNFSGHPLSQALNGRKGHFFAFLAKFNARGEGSNFDLKYPALTIGIQTADAGYFSTSGHRSVNYILPVPKKSYLKNPSLAV